MANDGEAPRKPSRQQLRAAAREKRNATGWISALGTDDPWLRQAIRTALGTRSVTRAELEEALGMSLAEPDSGRVRRAEPPGNGAE
jgi:hypothetical protein